MDLSALLTHGHAGPQFIYPFFSVPKFLTAQREGALLKHQEELLRRLVLFMHVRNVLDIRQLNLSETA